MSNIWDRVDRYFSKNEAWGNPDKISGLLLMVMYQIRCSSGWPMIIHCGTQGLHCEGSYHYKKLAVDFHFGIDHTTLLGQSQHLFDFFDEMQLADFVGFGLYPQWNQPGFHIDVRGYRARWAKLNGVYVSLTEGLGYVK